METWVKVMVLVAAAVVVIIAVYFIYHCYCKKESQKYRYSPVPPQDIELGLQSGDHNIPQDTEVGQQPVCDHVLSDLLVLQDTELGKQLAYDHALSDAPGSTESDHDNFPAPFIIDFGGGSKEESTLQHSPLSPTISATDRKLHSTIKTYIADVVIPSFKGQRAGYQFAVVLLLSESDYKNINKLKLIPSDNEEKPLINRDQTSMPSVEEYCNYIVACPVIAEHHHSEVEIFEKDHHSAKSRFDELWSAYIRHNFTHPKYILLYSWNLPCSNCTDVIIKSLREPPYNSATVFVTHTIEWGGESKDQRDKSKEKLISEGMIVEEVQYPTRISRL